MIDKYFLTASKKITFFFFKVTRSSIVFLSGGTEGCLWAVGENCFFLYLVSGKTLGGPVLGNQRSHRFGAGDQASLQTIFSPLFVRTVQEDGYDI